METKNISQYCDECKKEEEMSVYNDKVSPVVLSCIECGTIQDQKA